MRWLQLLSERLGEARAAVEEDIITGRASDYAEYKCFAGMIAAYKQAEDIAREVSEDIMRE